MKTTPLQSAPNKNMYKKYAVGTGSTDSNGQLIVTGLTFTPTIILLEFLISTTYSRFTYYSSVVLETFNQKGISMYNSTYYIVNGYTVTPTTNGFTISGGELQNSKPNIYWKAFA